MADLATASAAPELTRRSVLVLSLAALSGCTTFLPEGSTSAPLVTPAIASQKINETRAAYGRPPLNFSSTLARAAQNQANLMASRGEVSHTLGGTLRERVRAVDYTGPVGEIIAAGQDTLEKAIKGWLDSREHNIILLSTHFTEFGLAVAQGRAPYKVYWAMILGGDADIGR
ncbi:MAG: CAP domain-containing protein [Hyphomicrobiaceae bacterium]|nr:CAP domain-containing protein [Hyphomicrobiaceae bacterium]